MASDELGESDQESNKDSTRRLAIDVFRFLREFQKIRFREVVDYRQRWNLDLSNLPSHPGVNLRSQEPSAFLSVERVTLTAAPEVPSILKHWIEGQWRQPSNLDPTVKAQIERPGPEDTEVSEVFAADPVRVAEWDDYIQLWRLWRDEELPARQAFRLYDQIYDLRSKFQREPDVNDLYLADGLFVWHFADREIRHPILLQKAEIAFDAETATLSVGLSGADPELFNGVIAGADETDVTAFSRFREELDHHDDIWPLADEETTLYLKRLANSIAKGSFFETSNLTATDRPSVCRMPMLLEIPRGIGMADFIAKALADLESGGDSSPCLDPILGVYPGSLSDDGASIGGGVAPDEDSTVYFTKPANDDQLKIVRQYRNGGRVVVQGPPGTGKTHTIANLIGHFLAEGKNILVTAETTKALKVLREKVDPGLRPLCISVTESDAEGRELLKAGVSEMHRVKKETDPQELKKRVIQLESDRLQLIQKLKQARRDLFIAREGEIVPIRAGDQTFQPSDAARVVHDGSPSDSWLPGTIEPNSVQPISEEDMDELFASNAIVSTIDESNDTGDLLPIDALPTPEQVALTLMQLMDLLAEGTNRHEIDRGGQANLRTEETLISLHARLQSAVSTLGDGTETWRLRITDQGQRSPGTDSNWPSILDEGIMIVRRRESSAVEIHRHGVSLTHESAQLLEALRGISTHLAQGRAINAATKLMKPAWRKALEEPLVEGRPLRTANEAMAIIDAIEIKVSEQQFNRVWSGIAAPIGLPTTADGNASSADIAARLKEPILQCLAWSSVVWEPLNRELTDAGFDVTHANGLTPAEFASPGFASQLRWTISNVIEPALVDALKIVRVQKLQADLVGYDQQAAAATLACQSPLLQTLVSTLRSRDAAAYNQAFEDYEALVTRVPAIRRRNQFLGRIRPVAKTWAQSIALRTGPHGNANSPGNLKAAWKWKLLDMELTRRHALSPNEINRTIGQLKTQLAQTTADLARAKAWVHLHSRITGPVQAALERFRQAAAIITGKKAAVMVREAKEAMSDCASAVPVWIMPISRVTTSFDPQKTKFDVVIMDEASQVGVTGLAILHMAKTAVIVGDDEQTEPLQPGIETDKILGLAGAFLAAIKGGRQWNERMSVYRLALGPYSGGICLLEHFRCVPDIISFSSLRSYGGGIKPLRDDSEVATKPHVLHYQVPPTESHRPAQAIEAEFIVSLIQSSTEQPEYANASIGVVAMRDSSGTGYSKTIDDLVTKRLKERWREHHDFRCGTPPDFQGDERAIVFVAMGDAPPPAGTQLRLQRAEANENLWKKRYNVAASRAQDQLWVISSFSKDDVQRDDIRYALLDFAQDPAEWRRQATEENPQAESEFERLVYRDLTARGYKLTSQYPVGKRRIDMVAESNGKRCAIECDGERFHGRDQLESDMARQSDLERAGNWKFVRIRGSKYFKDAQVAIDEACEEMARVGVVPTAESQPMPPSTNDLLDRILMRAQELRQLWQAQEEVAGSSDDAALAALPA